MVSAIMDRMAPAATAVVPAITSLPKWLNTAYPASAANPLSPKVPKPRPPARPPHPPAGADRPPPPKPVALGPPAFPHPRRPAHPPRHFRQEAGAPRTPTDAPAGNHGRADNDRLGDAV